MFVSFEQRKNLKYKASPTDGKYRIKSDSFDARKRMGVLKYGGEDFYVNSTSLKSYLVFKLKNSTKRMYFGTTAGFENVCISRSFAVLCAMYTNTQITGGIVICMMKVS